MLSIKETIKTKNNRECHDTNIRDLVYCQIPPAWEVKPIAALQREASQMESDKGSFSSWGH